MDDCILIDFPADTYLHFVQHNMPMCKIKTCIISHSHSDHLYPADLQARAKGFSDITFDDPLVLYAGEASYLKITESLHNLGVSEKDVRAVKISPFESFCAEGYNITPLNAVHDPKSTPLIYLIEKNGKCVFYSNDTGLYPTDTWEYLKRYGKHIDVVSLDCTNGTSNIHYPEHMGITECMETREKLLQIGVCDQNTKFILNHFSHNGDNCLYDDMIKIAAPLGFDVSFDGMILEF